MTSSSAGPGASAPAVTAVAWGSFKSPPVDVLIAQSDADYSSPPRPIDVHAIQLIEQQLQPLPPTSPLPPSLHPPPSSLPSPSFSSSILSLCPLPPSLTSSPLLSHPLLRSSIFHLTPSFTFLNHGAFGSPLSALTDVQHRWLLHLEAQPLRFIDRQLLPLLVHTLRRLAAFLHCSPTSLALLPNVTTALTCVVHAMALHPTEWGLHPHHSSVLRLSLAYGAVKRQVEWMAKHVGVDVVEATITLPCTPPRRLRTLIVDEVDAAIRRCEEGGRPVAVAFFDHVTSNTAILLPLPALLALCHSRGIRTVVDGAHGPWQLPLRLDELRPSVYAGNLHKWMCNPKGAAFLYSSSPALTATLQPPAISHGFGHASFTSDFLWLGCHDYAALLTVGDACEVWEKGWMMGGQRVGWEEARAYSVGLCRWARQMLARVWGTRAYWDEQVEGEGEGGEGIDDEDGGELCMACVAVGWGDGVPGAGDRLQDRLYEEWDIECPVKTIDGRLYVRISAHMYNRPDDYIHLASAIERIRRG